LRAGTLKASGVKTRNGILHEFRSKPGFDVLILSPFVAGIGLTIVEANHVVHYGRWWNPAAESEATDRAYRIGQMKDVWVYLYQSCEIRPVESCLALFEVGGDLLAVVIGAAAPLAAGVTAYRLPRLIFRWLEDSLTVGALPFDHTGGCRTGVESFSAGKI